VFSTLTNVNFDSERFAVFCIKCHNLGVQLRQQLLAAGVTGGPPAATLPWFDNYGNPINFDLMKATGGQVSVEALHKVADEVR
jgi:hypothetical protein